MDDSISSTSQTRKLSPKKAKSKKPIKVVYISNPMKVKTSASEFMALVQKLTGQDAELPEDPTKFTDIEEVIDDIDGDNDDNNKIHDIVAKNDTVIDYHVKEVSDLNQQQYPIIFEDVEPVIERDNLFDVFDDDIFTPQMVENFTGILPEGLFM